MGYQADQGDVQVVAPLTSKGRELLLTDPESFEIKMFAVYDDEINYSLWNETHPNGDTYYGAAIENLPLLEPFETNLWQCKYPLIKDLPRDVIRMITIETEEDLYTITDMEDTVTIIGTVWNASVGSVFVTLSDINISNFVGGGGKPLDAGNAAPNLTALAGFRVPVEKSFPVGPDGKFQFELHAGLTTQDRTQSVMIKEPTTGVQVSVPVVTKKNNVHSVDVNQNLYM